MAPAHRPPAGPKPGERHSPAELCVVFFGEGWGVRWQGQLRLLAAFETRQQALNHALHLAWQAKVDVLVQQGDGTVHRLRPLQPVEPEKRRKPRAGSSER